VIVVALLALVGCSKGGDWTHCWVLKMGDLVLMPEAGDDGFVTTYAYRVVRDDPMTIEWRMVRKESVVGAKKEILSKGVVILKPGESIRCT
jgi:hypothetical protein